MSLSKRQSKYTYRHVEGTIGNDWLLFYRVEFEFLLRGMLNDDVNELKAFEPDPATSTY